MAKLSIVAGTTSKRLYVFIQDSSQTDGRGLTGLTFSSGSLVASYVLPGAARVAITLATQTVTGAYSSGGFVEVDSANMPGVYRFDPPDAALAAGNTHVLMMLKGASNMAPCVLEIELTAVNNQDAVRYGLTALPNAAAGANGGLPTGNASGHVAVASIDANAITATAINAAAITSAKFAMDAIDANALKADAVIEIQTAVAAGAVASVTGNVGGNVTGSVGSVVGAVGSVTGAVGSVTGNVGGNVAGSVGSLTVNNDKTGYALSTAGIQAVWDRATSALTTVGSIGKLLVDDIDAAISSRLASSSYTAPPSLASIVAGVWDRLTSALTTSGSIGKLLVDDIDAAISSRNSVAPDNSSITAIKTKTDNLPASPAAVGSAMTLSMTQVVPSSPTEGTVGYSLAAAETQGGGDWVLAGTVLTLKRKDGSTFVVFNLDDADAPTQRIAV